MAHIAGCRLAEVVQRLEQDLPPNRLPSERQLGELQDVLACCVARAFPGRLSGDRVSALVERVVVHYYARGHVHPLASDPSAPHSRLDETLRDLVLDAALDAAHGESPSPGDGEAAHVGESVDDLLVESVFGADATAHDVRLALARLLRSGDAGNFRIAVVALDLHEQHGKARFHPPTARDIAAEADRDPREVHGALIRFANLLGRG